MRRIKMLPVDLILKPEILTHPNIPKPLHGLNPRVLKGKDWWDVTRKLAYASTNYHCISCGVHKSEAKYHQWLEGHEFHVIDYEKGTAEVKEIVPLCHSCHNFIHSGLHSMNYSNGKIGLDRYIDILQHGCDILFKNNLKGFGYTIRKAIEVGCINIPEADTSGVKMAEWPEWHLILEGEKYYSKFKSFEEWRNHNWKD